MLEVSNPKPKQSSWRHRLPFSNLTTSSRALKDFTKLFSQVEKNFSWQNLHIVKIVAISEKKAHQLFAWYDQTMTCPVKRIVWPHKNSAVPWLSTISCLNSVRRSCESLLNINHARKKKKRQVKSLADCNAGLAEHQQGTHCQQMSRSITIYNHKLKIALLLSGFCFHKTWKIRIQRSHLPCV